MRIFLFVLVGMVGVAQSTGVVPGTYGDATHIPRITVDATGHITSIVLVDINGNGGVVTPPPPPPTTSTPLSIEARYGAILDGDTGQLLWGKSEHSTHMMASTTKAMTFLLALEHCNNLDHQVVISPMADGQTGTSASLIAGSIFTMKNLIYAKILKSGNDAAWAVAEHVGGVHLEAPAGLEVPTFVARMNSRAAELGLVHTRYANPHGGIDAHAPIHYTCAYDLARLGRIILNLDPGVTVTPFAAEVVGRSRWKGECVSCNGSNPNIWYNGAVTNCTINGGIGIKSGKTEGSGTHYLGAARRNGRTIITATLAGTEITRNHRPMMDYGFQLLGLERYPSSGDCQERSAAITYGGTWNHSNAPSPLFDQDYHSYSNTLNATASMAFVGSGIEWWSTRSPTRGITEVSIDGAVVAMVDPYSAATIPSAAVYSNPSLPFGQHTIQLRVTRTKHSAATDYITSVDAFKVRQ